MAGKAKYQQFQKETVDTIGKLREATRVSFDNVTADVKNMLKTIQRLNERAGQVESQNLILIETIRILSDRLDVQTGLATYNETLRRIVELENFVRRVKDAAKKD